MNTFIIAISKEDPLLGQAMVEELKGPFVKECQLSEDATQWYFELTVANISRAFVLGLHVGANKANKSKL